jgi:hypothetical protein
METFPLIQLRLRTETVLPTYVVERIDTCDPALLNERIEKDDPKQTACITDICVAIWLTNPDLPETDMLEPARTTDRRERLLPEAKKSNRDTLPYLRAALRTETELPITMKSRTLALEACFAVPNVDMPDAQRAIARTLRLLPQ